jgi:hypothetical protein
LDRKADFVQASIIFSDLRSKIVHVKWLGNHVDSDIETDRVTSALVA